MIGPMPGCVTFTNTRCGSAFRLKIRRLYSLYTVTIPFLKLIFVNVCYLNIDLFVLLKSNTPFLL